MSYPVITAAILIEANGAALNNAGSQPGERLDNAVAVKQIQIGRNRFPYVSGQAIRRWWREVLYTDFAWTPSPVTREAKSAYTEGNPIAYADDDLFGYMAAKKAKKSGKKPKNQPDPELSIADELDTDADESADAGGTQRRVSPLKNSLLIAVTPNTITSDFGHFSRDLPVENPNMVPFEHEHYTTLLQGTFCLSLTDVGRFECGPMRDLAIGTTTDGTEVVQNAEGLAKPQVLALPVVTRRMRVAQTLEALGRLRHGANLTRNLSDVTPAIILLGFLDGGNAPFQNLFTPVDKGVSLNLARLRSVVKDYASRIMDGKTLYFGYRPGILINEEEVISTLQAGFEGVSFVVDTPGTVIQQAAKRVLESDLISQSQA